VDVHHSKGRKNEAKGNNGHRIGQREQKCGYKRPPEPLAIEEVQGVLALDVPCSYAKEDEGPSSKQADPELLACYHIGDKRESECCDTAVQRICGRRSQPDHHAA